MEQLRIFIDREHNLIPAELLLQPQIGGKNGITHREHVLDGAVELDALRGEVRGEGQRDAEHEERIARGDEELVEAAGGTGHSPIIGAEGF